MLRLVLTLAVAFPVLMLTACVAKPTLQDISPDLANGTSRAVPSTAGLTVSLAGNSSRVYAVSLDAGVWRSDGADKAWEQLANSPQRAYSIAVDPKNNQHVAVGEREDDKANPSARHSGVWETLNGGDAWSYILDPYTLGCPAQAVPSVAFNALGTLFAATSCGVAVRPKNTAKFSLAANTTNIGAITAIAVSPQRTWARTSNLVLVGDVTGTVWQARNFPPATTFVNPGELFSLAASDQFAYFSCCVIMPDPPCAASNKMLIYNLTLDHWMFQPTLPDSTGKPALGCDGTGLGGSKFIHAYSITRGRLSTTRLFVSAGQEIYEAASILADGSAPGWFRTLGTMCNGCTNQDNVHPDLWDFLLDPDADHMWVSNDGGVYERSGTTGSAWVMRNHGLHTHHVHTLTLMGSQGAAPAMSYPTSDNDAWFSTLVSSPSSWHYTTNLGDANWSVGDVANPHQSVVALRRDVAALAQDSPPYILPITVSYDRSVDGPDTIQFIQTMAGESTPDTVLDAELLTTLPLQYFANGALQNVFSELGNGHFGNAEVIIRNQHFESSADINLSKGKGWTLETLVPQGTTRFWVAGGHINPFYYVYAAGTLYRQVQIPGNIPQWQALNVQGKLTDPQPYPPSGIVDSVWKGPVFVNPYMPSELYVLTETGVQVSEDSGSTFNQDKTLTSLISRNGAYPLSPGFSGGNEAGVRKGNRSDRNAMGALSDMAFLRSNPSIVAAVSPYTGLFYKSGNVWQDLSPYLARPLSPISSVAMDSSTIYFAMEGRGIFRLIGYQQAPR